MLGSLQASQIARIEVMTNPSAQFSAYGSGGIINVILRRDFAEGVGGSAVAGVGTQNYANLRLSPTLSLGRWTFSASPSLTRSGSETERRLDRLGKGDTPARDRAEVESGRGRSRAFSATSQVSYVPSDKERYDLTGSIGRQTGRSRRTALISSPSGGFEPFAQAIDGRASLGSQSASLERKVTGSGGREEFKLAISWSRVEASTRNSFVDRLALDARRLDIAQTFELGVAGLKADYVRPIGKLDTLSAGLELQRETQSSVDEVSGETESGPLDIGNSFSGRFLDLSGYATLQTRIASVRVLPGLRIQRRRFEFGRASGLAPIGATLVFPSLHAERVAGPLTTTFSISSRADWPSIGQFFPYRRFTGPTTIDTGNPNLKPQRALNMEAAARLAVSGQQLSLTLYNRRRSRVQSSAFEVTEEGDILAIPINSGTRISRGGQLSVRGRLCKTCSYSASAWVSEARFDLLEGTAIVRDRALEYGANASLEYSRGAQGKSGFRQLTLNMRYFGPTRSFRTDASAFATVDVSYTHFLTDRLSLVSTINSLIGNREVVTSRFSPDFSERSVSEIVGPTFRLSLTYNLKRPR